MTHVLVANIEFICPHCEVWDYDSDESYLKRINKSKSNVAYLRCRVCKNRFGLTTDITGNYQTFKINKKEEK